MAITAALVKELRERTGAGMMECKKALVETDGDIEAAIEAMRKSGMAKADKKAGRVAAEGVIVIQTDAAAKNAAIVEVNCETDFVAKGDDFINFANGVCAQVLADPAVSLESLNDKKIGTDSDATIDERRREMIAKIGENMSIRRIATMSTSGTLGVYLHGSRIGVVVDMEGGDNDLARDVAMHVAASKPLCVNESEIDPTILAKEKEIFAAQAKESGKPDNIIEKMVEGRVKKYVNEVTLLGQAFVKDPDTSVADLLNKANATVIGFQRFEVGEGIEKKTENFADEVMAQVKGS
ncbi:MAG: translation elongation factor Ts [Gammaproteobacteria bacterium]|nr:translation elongation factor Ts [Gammaproteobacteria bacterium]MDH5729482.1 translation elongation factor Ts [Gammaproteobacteria bacterium]